ncbi:uncharacterized protein CDAR_223871 [Caerostris darwini]|uniref:Phospholipase A2-like central domain-containing protein n=1 Tax=Caerostris darwini TaxID=1538125 RepID=A0AAV4WQM6_9ARAC|nr:uncharacterized protein CDAR_223871 [Caerostris darwini]
MALAFTKGVSREGRHTAAESEKRPCPFQKKRTREEILEKGRCCLQHDWCYAFISCPQTLIYFVPYTWQCMNPGAAHCGVASMPGVSQKCATQLCECDREFARCVSHYPCPRKKPGCKASNYMMLQTINNNDI